ncbi:AMIN domain-containing protein [Desulfosarcina cetonica]|uniref:AMIN domain-containing protein n=1 Tax=Desulfosarcina cetonica TaxID=90730 RepID=UPI0006D04AFD|nr:AMIN domain-containing protein [Desulfosarcina cetonica]
MRVVMAALLASLFFLGTAWALTIKDRYYQAENAYAALKKNPKHQKYRDKWLACIEKYKLVQRLDPDGPWAAAGFYKAGLLYLELYQRSRLGADQQEAVDLFQRIIQKYPNSRYTPKSRDQLSRLGKPVVSPNTAAAAKQLEHAHAAYDRLSASANRQKYRDQWQRGIDLFQKAYQTDPKGPYAAECLYMTAVLYRGLSKASHRTDDGDAAVDYFRRVQREFANSTYAAKAADDLKPGGGAGRARAASAARPSPAGNSADPLAELIAQSGKPSAKASPGKTGNGPSGSKLVTVQDLRVWSNPKYTRVVVDADQETPFTHRLLKKDPSINKPPRLYLELSRSRLGKNIDKLVPINDNLLIDARAGQYTNDSVRIVVDIKSFKNYKIFSLKNPFRIVMDVWGVDTTGKPSTKQLASIPPPQSTGKLPPGAIARQLALGVSRIIIDPGHGGKDYGARIREERTREKRGSADCQTTGQKSGT